MGLPLNTVAPARGWRWITQAFALWWRRPLAFVGLFAGFLLLVLLLVGLVPVVGGLLGLALVPMLSTGFMIATQSALAGGPVHTLQYIEALRVPDKPRRLAQWQLCGGYALLSVAVIVLSDWIDGGSLDALMRAMADAQGGQPSAGVDSALDHPMLGIGIVARAGLALLLSIPFWYASALVHWGGQSAGQALFSSTVAVWRTRGAFLVYALGWAGLMLAGAALAMLLVLALGMPKLVGVLAFPAGLVFSAVFYMSLWFGYVDNFGEPGASEAPRQGPAQMPG